MANLISTLASPYLGCRSKGPCDAFDPWVRWEKGQVGIREFVRRRRRWRRLEIWNLEIWEFQDLGIWRSGELEIQKFGDLGTPNSEIWGPTNQKMKILKIQIRSAQNVGKV